MSIPVPKPTTSDDFVAARGLRATVPSVRPTP